MANPGTSEIPHGGRTYPAADAKASLDVTDQMISSNSRLRVLKPRNDLKKFAFVVFQDDALYENVLLILMNAFVWPDSTASTKSAMVFWPLFQPIIERGPSNDIVALVLTELLKGYQVNEYCSGASLLLLWLLFKFYLSLRPRYLIMKDIFKPNSGNSTEQFWIFRKRRFCHLRGRPGISQWEKVERLFAEYSERCGWKTHKFDVQG